MEKIDYHQLEVGHEFPPTGYQADSSMVAAYLKAVEETSDVYQDTDAVPPMAVAAYALAALFENISLPPGAIHVSQEFEFIGTVSTKDTLASYARVTKKQDRGKLHLLTIGLNVFNEKQKEILTGKTSLILPD